jgi:AI-2 transport protein TqsA
MAERYGEQSWLTTASLVILAVVALAAALIYTRAVMIPFVVALFIVALVSPIQDFQVKRLRLPRIIAIIVTLLVVFFVIAMVSVSVVQAIRTIASTAGEYSESFAELADELLKPLEYIYQREELRNEEAARATQPEPEVGPGVPDVNKAPAATSEPSRPPKGIQRIDTRQILSDLISNARQIIRDLTNYIVNVLRNTVTAILGLIAGVFFVSIFVIFLLAGRDPYAEHSQMYRDVVHKIRRYLGTKVVVSAACSVLVWASLSIIGLPLAGVFGVLTFLMRFIPSIGPIIVTLLPIPLALAQFHQQLVPIILVVAIPGTVHSILGNLVEPKLMGEGLDLHPVTVLLALSFWSLLWGIVGMFLAVPITAAIRIVLIQFDTLRPIGNLLAGDFGKPLGTGRS